MHEKSNSLAYSKPKLKINLGLLSGLLDGIRIASTFLLSTQRLNGKVQGILWFVKNAKWWNFEKLTGQKRQRKLAQFRLFKIPFFSILRWNKKWLLCRLGTL
jgi:hypothetical protein